jgi:hypothetical protein
LTASGQLSDQPEAERHHVEALKELAGEKQLDHTGTTARGTLGLDAQLEEAQAASVLAANVQEPVADVLPGPDMEPTDIPYASRTLEILTADSSANAAPVNTAETTSEQPPPLHVADLQYGALEGKMEGAQPLVGQALQLQLAHLEGHPQTRIQAQELESLHLAPQPPLPTQQQKACTKAAAATPAAANTPAATEAAANLVSMFCPLAGSAVADSIASLPVTTIGSDFTAVTNASRFQATLMVAHPCGSAVGPSQEVESRDDTYLGELRRGVAAGSGVGCCGNILDAARWMPMCNPPSAVSMDVCADSLPQELHTFTKETSAVDGSDGSAGAGSSEDSCCEGSYSNCYAVADTYCNQDHSSASSAGRRSGPSGDAQTASHAFCLDRGGKESGGGLAGAGEEGGILPPGSHGCGPAVWTC